MTPNEQMLQFLTGLPDTIRSNVEMQVVLFFNDVDNIPVAERSWQTLAHDSICPARVDLGVSAVLAAAVFDFIFASDPALMRGAAEYTSSKYPDIKSFQEHALRMPLVQKHFLKAKGDWEVLRKSTLSLQALHRYRTTRLPSSLGKIGRT